MNSEILTENQKEILREFNNDSKTIGEQTTKFLELVYPSYLVDRNNIKNYIDKSGSDQLKCMTFFRISSCTADNVEKLFENISERFQKLFTALYSINTPIAYGLISKNGITNLVIGTYPCDDIESVKSITRGMLSSIELDSFEPSFISENNITNSYGILSGIPSLYVNGEKQNFSLSSIMRSLNGQNYSLLFIAKPVDREIISRNISELISVRDQAFAVSKRNVARSASNTETKTETDTSTDTKNSVAGQVGSGAGTSVGAAAGAILGTFLIPIPVIGTGLGTALGGAVGGGLGTLIGNLVGKGKSHSEGYSKSISDAITKGETVSGDIQNGFALELINYADSALERLKAGQNNGIWQTAIAYSAEKKHTRDIIKACLCGELSKLDSEKLPMLAFEPEIDTSELLVIPDFLNSENQNPLCSFLNSAELGLLCTVPTESVPDFELKLEKKFPLIASRSFDDVIQIGNVVDGKRILNNMPFALSELDLNKHTFVCGITGSGKTTTVKKILFEAKKPFLVIESAKKEYRNLTVDKDVYTLGRPEINALKLNPFYIMPGVSPQAHIDYLKDLFNASFSFYGPMPYILEKCLHSVYSNKGWDLTLGYHPLLVNSNSPIDFFDINIIKERYSNTSHKYLFPTMQDLKDEIARYIEEELKYDGEVAGNIKTAMKVRLENLCVGTKGYTFNTNEFIDFEELLQKNVVFELDGLTDDSDKAFSVGLLVIFINEYRQVQKEKNGLDESGLKHLLVIEEAHRLLKNVNTERTTEHLGNPIGKAVEHFTNMIAEMRSYGQGVIVAEQIPTKLAPDVIKNTSTKIVQRIVSIDDQIAMANTIGISNKDAIQLGSLETGYAYCHKEGMVLPAPVHILNYSNDEQGSTNKLDDFVSDELLYNNKNDRFDEISLSMVRSILGGRIKIKNMVISILNTLLCENETNCKLSCDEVMKCLYSELINCYFSPINSSNQWRIQARFLSENIITMMVRGIYCTGVLPDNNFGPLLESVLYSPEEENILKIKSELKKLYGTDVSKYAKINIASLIRRSMTANVELSGTIRSYFFKVSDVTVNEIEKMVKGDPLK